MRGQVNVVVEALTRPVGRSIGVPGLDQCNLELASDTSQGRLGRRLVLPEHLLGRDVETQPHLGVVHPQQLDEGWYGSFVAAAEQTCGVILRWWTQSSRTPAPPPPAPRSCSRADRGAHARYGR